ncbi:unnamed protein product [Lota lota]
MASTSQRTIRSCLLWLHVLLFWITQCPALPHGGVFASRRDASAVLKRSRRANTFLEEVKRGDLERECLEERCSYEEAREIYQLPEPLNEFWNVYIDGDACISTPCVNNGVCKDSIGGYSCFCQANFQGFNCEIAIPGLCENNNGGCDHFCHVVNGDVHCSCTDGYFLSADQKSCNSNETYRCGAVFKKNTRSVFIYEPSGGQNSSAAENASQWSDGLQTPEFLDPVSLFPWQPEDYPADGVREKPVLAEHRGSTRIVGGDSCPPGECPWQALLLNEEHRGFCGGTILNHFLILTAAHCMNQSRYIYVILGEFDTKVKEGQESVHNVETVLIHKRYTPGTFHNDIALIKLKTPISFSQFIIPACLPQREFAEKVLMRQPQGVVSGLGRLGEVKQQATVLQRLYMPFVDRATCMESSQFRITNHMFCAGYGDGKRDACYGDSGGPHVTPYRDTFFLTGVVSWGEGCARQGKYGVYTQVSKYIRWIREGMKLLMPRQQGPQAGRGRRDAGPLHQPWAPASTIDTVWSRDGVVRRAALARSVFVRPRRANSFFIEELLQGDLERECYEEHCSYEEAREYFEDTPKAISFWTLYYDGDQCQPNPCLHGGNCTDRVGGFLCTCRDSYYGPTCEQGTEKRPAGPDTSPQVTTAEVGCSVDGPGSCHQFCRVWNIELICSCTEGFTLHTDQRTCLPDAEYPCGRWLPSKENQTALAPPPCSDGRCPWQVSLVDREGEELCQGVVLGGVAILTSAGCYTGRATSLHHITSSGVQKVSILGAFVHHGFQHGLHDNDLAVLHLATPLVFGPSLFPLCLPTKDFSENVLMHAGSPGLTWLGLGSEVVTYMTLDDCRRLLNTSQPMSNKMFCMAGQNTRHGQQEVARRWRASPVASRRHGTAFLTGLLLPPPPRGRGLVFTKLSRFLPWITGTLDRIQRLHDDVTPQVGQHPEPHP